jgi:RNA polymerase sigma-70 factor, ECF subfamily
MIQSIANRLLKPEEESNLLAKAVVDASAFGQLYQVYVRSVYRYLYYRTGNRMDAEDLTAQVFIQAWEGMVRYRHEGHFLAWLMAIARNRAIDFFRTQKPTIGIEHIEALLLQSTPNLLEGDRLDHLRLLAGMISRIDEEEKELLQLRFAACLPFQDIASLLGKNEAAVKKQFYRLLERMRQALEGEAHESR